MEPPTSNRNSGLPRNTPGIVFSLLLVGAGVVLLLDRMGIAEVSFLFAYWPGALIALGLVLVLESADMPARIWGGVIGLAGIVLLLRNLGFTHVAFWQLWWPLMLIGGGLSLLWGVLHPPYRRDRRDFGFRPFGFPSFGGNWSSSLINETAVFGGGPRNFTGPFEGGKVSAVFGGFRIDLTEAEIQGNEAILHIDVVFGGANIRIPPEWNLVLRGVPVFGGFADNTRHPLKGPATKTLIIRGAAVFGGIEVRN